MARKSKVWLNPNGSADKETVDPQAEAVYNSLKSTEKTVFVKALHDEKRKKRLGR